MIESLLHQGPAGELVVRLPAHGAMAAVLMPALFWIGRKARHPELMHGLWFLRTLTALAVFPREVETLMKSAGLVPLQELAKEECRAGLCSIVGLLPQAGLLDRASSFDQAGGNGPLAGPPRQAAGQWIFSKG